MQKRDTLVCYVPVFPQNSETFILNKCIGLDKRGWNIHIICDVHNKKAWEYLNQQDNAGLLPTRVFQNFPHKPAWKAALYFLPVLIGLFIKRPVVFTRYIIRGHKSFGWNIFKKVYLDARIILLAPDVIHYEFGGLAREKIYLARLLQCKAVVSFRGSDINISGVEKSEYYKEVFQTSHAMHFLGTSLYQQALKRGMTQSKKYVLIPPAIDCDFFSPSSTSDYLPGLRPLRLLSISRLHWVKGLEYSIQAIWILCQRNIQVTYDIIGDGTYFEVLAYCIHQYGLNNIITLSGYHSPNEAKKKLQSADIFLHPSVSEGFCNSVIESQAMQTPVICSDAGGLSENVIHNHTGIIVPRRDPSAIADAVMMFSKQPSFINQMGKRGRERIVSQFFIKDQISKFEELYKSL
ncbi:MAG: glycosyltransferase family 4 protein [Fibrobacteria bacterium]|nr:glycosyltransferase family 4 protein [Fibrobacteria bacterium]